MKKKILVVDDDLYLRELYIEILQEAGYDVYAVTDGAEALALLKQGGYALTLLDMIMPRIDGLGVLEASAKFSPPVPNGPIIVLTNLSHDPVIQEATKRGAQGYLIKTDLTPKEIIQTVKKFLNE
jgi:CheY-like chemotaxis protein